MRASRVRLIAAIAVPLIVAALLGIVMVNNQWQRARLQTDVAVRASVANAVGEVRSVLRDQLDAATAAAQPGERTVPLSAVGTKALPTVTATVVRDTGTATLDDTLNPPGIVIPVYRTGTTPINTEQRRQDVTGYRVIPLNLHGVLASLASATGGLLLRGPNRVITEINGTPSSGARTFGVDMQLSSAPGWTVRAWRPSPSIPGVAWFYLLVLLVVFGAVSATLAYLLRRHEAMERHQLQLERDRLLVTGLAPVLQASLDMGEVLPAVSSHLSDGLALAGLSLATPTPSGERQVFAWGTPTDPTVMPTSIVPEALDRGATHALSLTRGGRVLGVLRIVAGEPLSREDLVALAAASELVGSTLANAEAFAQQQDLVERMRSVDELKTVFLATASHELRTPVTAIVGFSTLLLGQWEAMNGEQGRGLMERVLSNGRRLETLIEQLLDFSRLERGLPQSSEEILDLGKAVGKVLADQPELVGEHELRLRLADNCVIRGSTAAVERIVTNLVGNAAKYSPAGTTITVTVWAEADRVQVVVDDQGPGVSPADRKKIFSRFYRGRGDAVRSTKGVGIGLAIVSEYAATMSGVASVATAPGGGARFVVSLPAVRAMAGAARQGEPNVALS